jgi:hypothetical protein
LFVDVRRKQNKLEHARASVNIGLVSILIAARFNPPLGRNYMGVHFSRQNNKQKA